ncbi:putative Sister chromatid cohesion 1 protein [Melia azedarach]|uniref:Sister chromatid cohesion 1 protein n=1 Tax=Melia azedarach TaxID=155640 RepID=A0ACC1Z102_MELAZ|nr:putative Sister chromatid cohesion 1 protein [Melia azedarach]
MFYSRSLLARKGPLGAIWVAAYCFKRLKKAQIFETNIPTSVDEILQKELDVMTYRVLAYLLLGLVRIYSKKVEYLYDDCQDVKIKINGFLVSEKSTKHLEVRCTPDYSITLPDKFELDAFDLEILEDISEVNVLPREEITLKDGASTAGGIGHYSLAQYHYDEFAACQDICSTDYALTEDIFLSHSMEIDMSASMLHDLSNFEASMEKLQSNSFSQKQRENLDISCGIEEEPADPIEPFAEDHMSGEEHIKVQTTAQLKDGGEGEATMEKLQDDSFHGAEEEPLDHQSDGEQIKFPDMAHLENEMCQPISEENDNYKTNLQESTERLLHPIFHQACTDVEIFCGSDDEPPKQLELSGEEQQTKAEQMRCMEIALSGNGKCQFTTEEDPLSITLDATPQSKFPDVSGATTPEFMIVPTPATKERARILTKRKCCFDDAVVFPNDVIRQRIQDSSDLVSKRRKAPPTALAAWKASQISNLSQGFLVPLLPCISSELRSLFCLDRLKILKTAKPVEPLDPEFPAVDRSSENMAPETTVGISSENVAIGSSQNVAIAPGTPIGKSSENMAIGYSENVAIAPETPVGRSSENMAIGSPENMAIAPEKPDGKSLKDMTIGSSEHMEIAPETPIGKSSENMAIGSSEKMDIVPETPSVRSSDSMAIAPETPIGRSSKNMANAPDTPTGTSSERMAGAAETPIFQLAASRTFETLESHKNAHSIAVAPAYSYQTLKKELSLSRDEELDLILMSGEPNLSEADKEEPHRLSARTRMVARYLHRRFVYHKERREDEAVKLLQLLEGKTKKESARLFYEILALKTKGYVDVQQDDPFGDILIWKAPQWDKSCAALCL